MLKLGTGTITYGDDVETLLFDWGTIKVLSEPQVTKSEQTSFAMAVLDPGKGHDHHNHPGSEEIIFLMSGVGQQMVDDQPPVTIRPGASIYIPAGVYHSTLNTGWEPMRLLVVYSPAGPERLLRDIPGCQVLPPGEIPG
jgi:oxalate decarboxylase/phosphoglucose isomerase-like protein (cupin superfamily)